MSWTGARNAWSPWPIAIIESGVARPSLSRGSSGRVDVRGFAAEGAQDRAVAGARNDEVRQERHFSHAARRIHHELRQGDAGEPALESLHEAKTGREGRAQMGAAAHGVGLQEVIGP